MVEGTPPGDALPPPPQRATPARKGARCGTTGAGSQRPHQPHPEHTGRGTPAARSRGRAAGGGTAPDTRRPSRRWQATPPRGRLPATPAARSPHKAYRPRGQRWTPTPTHPRPQHVGSGPQQSALWAGSRGRDSARPQTPLTQWWKAPPLGMPFRHPHSEQRRPARAHAVGPVLGPHARTDRTRDTRVADPGYPLQRTGRRGRDRA